MSALQQLHRMTERRCRPCSCSHPITAEYWREVNSGGRIRLVCISLEKKRGADYRQRNRDKSRIETRIGQAKYRKTILGRYSKLLRQAKERNLEVELTIEEYTTLLQYDMCHYCGIQIGENTGHNIDRVDNLRGYFLDNSVLCCRVCNIAKHAMTLDDFRSWITRVYCNWVIS